MEKNRYELKIKNNTYIFKLLEVLENKSISRYQLEKDTGIDHKTIQNYCLGNIKRIDLRVIAILCEYLNCNFSEIIEVTTKTDIKETI